jgi:hypothetical protein
MPPSSTPESVTLDCAHATPVNDAKASASEIRFIIFSSPMYFFLHD